MLYCNSIIFWVVFYFNAFYLIFLKRYLKYFFYTVTFKKLIVPLDFINVWFYKFMNLADIAFSQSYLYMKTIQKMQIIQGQQYCYVCFF